jgi:hypothetical protein
MGDHLDVFRGPIFVAHVGVKIGPTIIGGTVQLYFYPSSDLSPCVLIFKTGQVEGRNCP